MPSIGRSSLKRLWGFRAGAVFVEDTRRAPGDDDTFILLEPFRGRSEGQNLGVNAQFAHFPRDQVAVLPTRVQNGDFFHTEERIYQRTKAFRVRARLLNPTSISLGYVIDPKAIEKLRGIVGRRVCWSVRRS